MHRIEEYDKQEGIKQAWHGLTIVRKKLDLDHNCLTEWDIVPAEVFLKMPDEKKPNILLPFKQLICTDKPDLLIGQPYNPDTYHPITNEQFLKMVHDAISGTGHKVVSIGSVRNRGRIFISVEVKGLSEFKAGGRTFEPYLNFGNGHDKSSVLWVNLSEICTVCDNTFSFNLHKVEDKQGNGGLSLEQRHTKNVEAKLPEISKLVDQAVGVQREFAEAFESLTKKKVTVKTAERIYAGFIAMPQAEELSTRSRNIVSRLTDLFQTGAGNKGENRADLFQGATQYYTHENSGGKRLSRQYFSSEFGTGAQRKHEFWRLVKDNELFEATEERGAEVLEGKKPTG